tara:strand:+ start:174 stop:464 length:291 start_codon:yes stop_codon:yes gene_type:complete
MSDLDIINNITSEPDRPPDHVSLEEIINSIPCMSLNNPATFALYLHYNKHLEEDEKTKVNNIIEKLKRERSAANKKNIRYMERDKGDMEKLMDVTE